MIINDYFFALYNLTRKQIQQILLQHVHIILQVIETKNIIKSIYSNKVSSDVEAPSTCRYDFNQLFLENFLFYTREYYLIKMSKDFLP
jgi:hypothetical protein